MHDGIIEQMGTASEIYERPATRFIADFVGQINLLDGAAHGTDNGLLAVTVAGTTLRVPDTGASGTVSIGVRPEQMSLIGAGVPVPAGHNAIAGTVRSRMFAGNRIRLEIDAGTAKPIAIEAHPNTPTVEPGAAVRVVWKPEHSVLLTR